MSYSYHNLCYVDNAMLIAISLETLRELVDTLAIAESVQIVRQVTMGAIVSSSSYTNTQQ